MIAPKLIVFIFLIYCSSICHSEPQVIDSLQKIEALSRIALLWHHPRAMDSDNITENFSQLLQDLYSRNITNDHTDWNCTALSQYATLPKSFCDDETFQCMTSKDMLSLVPESSSVSDALARLCPLLLLQLQNRACSDPGTATPKGLRPPTVAVWGYGILFVTIISCCSLVGVVLLPLLSKSIYQGVLMLFEGLAVGSLVGSSLFHLIPQTFKLVGQDKQHNYLWRSLLIFGGIYLFYISERFMKVVMDVKQKRKQRKSRYIVDENSREFLKPVSEPTSSVPKNLNSDTVGNGHVQILTADNLNNCNSYKMVTDVQIENKDVNSLQLNNVVPQNHHSHHHEHTIHFEQGKSAIGTVAWMIIFGDGLHNFIDGLSIGAAFSESILAGISISVAVICEEFPHELGDFAVLLSAGMSMKQALCYNFLSAITCYLGLVFGILLGDLAEGAPYIFALAAGMFLYIALVDMLGELNEALAEARSIGTKKQLKVFIIQNIGIILGIAILFIMARFAEHFNFENLSAFESNYVDEFDDKMKQMYSGFQEAKNLQTLLTP